MALLPKTSAIKINGSYRRSMKAACFFDSRRVVLITSMKACMTTMNARGFEEL